MKTGSTNFGHFLTWKSFFFEADFWEWEVQRDSKNVIFNYANDIQLKQEVTFLLVGKKPSKRAIFTLLFTWKWKKWNVSNFFINISINNHHEFNFCIFSTLFWGIPCFFTSKDNKVINLPFLLYLTLWCNLCKWIQHGLKKLWSIHDASMCLRASVKMKLTKIMSTRL